MGPILWGIKRVAKCMYNVSIYQTKKTWLNLSNQKPLTINALFGVGIIYHHPLEESHTIGVLFLGNKRRYGKSRSNPPPRGTKR